MLSIGSFLKQEDKYTFSEFISSVKTSLRADVQGITKNFDNDTMSEIHKNLLAKFNEELKLPAFPLAFTEHCSNKLIKLMTDEDKVLKDVKKAVEEGRPVDKFGACIKTFQRYIHVKEVLLFNDNKLIVPADLRSPIMSLLHKTHPGQFGMKSLAENIWWPHLYRQIYYHDKNCIECIKAGKNLKFILGTNNTESLPILSEPNEELDLDFACPLDKNWGNSKYLLLCIDHFSKFPSAKVVNNTSASSLLSFMSD